MSQEDIFIYAVIGVATLVTFSTRILGLISSRKLDESSPVFTYANYISYALVGALVVKLIVLPNNDLGEVPLLWRISLSLLCVAAYIIHKKYLLVYLILMGAGLTTLQYIPFFN